MNKPGEKDTLEDADKTRLHERISAAWQASLGARLAPGLYIVSTPIGNLEDMTLRALSVLERADMTLCEDTRHSRKLVSHYGLSCALQPYHDHNAQKVRPHILAALDQGKSVALISDAGTPLVSDPGYKLVREALDSGFAVHSIPGASASLAALTSSGLPSDHFYFEGFLPSKQGARKKRLEALRDIPSTLLFYEAPSRLGAMLSDALEVLGEREGVVAKELTKLHEALLRGPLDALVRDAGSDFGNKGEFVVVIAPPVLASVADEVIVRALASALAETSLRDASHDIAQAFGVTRSRVYSLGLALKEQTGSPSEEPAGETRK